MNFEDSRLYKAIVDDAPHRVARHVLELTESGRDVSVRDERGQTFLHLVVRHADKFKSRLAAPVVYQLSLAGVDVNVKDAAGSTCLHHVVSKSGAWRILVALMRCGADSSLEDADGRTAERILVEDKPTGAEEMLHWFYKFKPGLAAAVSAACTTPDPDPEGIQVVERLLRSWCRVQNVGRDADKLSSLLRRYEGVNELAISVLAGSAQRVRKLLSKGIGDINTKDESYEYLFDRSPAVPQPLLATAWELDNVALIDALMDFKPDTSVPYFNQYNRAAKPLFFQLIRGIPRPSRARIVHRILRESDMSLRNGHGQTILFEAMQESLPNDFLCALIRYGVDVSARDYKGRTARQFASFVGSDPGVVDAHVVALMVARRRDELRALALRSYAVCDVLQAERADVCHLKRRLDEDRTMRETAAFLARVPKMQADMTKLLLAADRGDLKQLTNLCAPPYGLFRCVNNCGQTILHRALLAGNLDIVEHIVTEFPELSQIGDNMLRLPLHYAYALLDVGHELVTILQEACARPETIDVKGYRPVDYSKDRLSTYQSNEFQREITRFEARVYLRETDLEDRLRVAIAQGNKRSVAQLMTEAASFVDLSQFNRLLFQCLDYHQPVIATYLIRCGCDSDIWKRYEACDPTDDKCVLRLCAHPLVSLRAQAAKLGYEALSEYISTENQQKMTRDSTGRRIPNPYEEMAKLGGVM